MQVGLIIVTAVAMRVIDFFLSAFAMSIGLPATDGGSPARVVGISDMCPAAMSLFTVPVTRTMWLR